MFCRRGRALVDAASDLSSVSTLLVVWPLLLMEDSNPSSHGRKHRVTLNQNGVVKTVVREFVGEW